MIIFLIIAMICIVALTAMLSHERGYNKGQKYGYSLGKATSNVNEYIRKIDTNTLRQHDIDSFETISKLP